MLIAIKSNFDYDYLMSWFYDNKEDLSKMYPGKHLLIDEHGIRGAFDKHFDAVKWAFENKLEAGYFIVQETNPKVFPLAPFIYRPTKS